MNLFEAFRVALTALMIHKVRALLTMVGIIIGVGAVIGMQSIGAGFSNYLASEFNRLGDGVLYIQPQVDSDDEDVPLAPRLTAADAAAIMAPGAAPAVRDAAIEFTGGATIGTARERYSYTVKGVSSGFFRIGSTEIGSGRLFGDAEEASLARVAVIGDDVAETMFGGVGLAIGERITIDGVGFEVIGVLDESFNQAAAAAGSFNNPAQMVYVPYATARARLFRNQMTARVDVGQITVQAISRDEVDAAIQQVTQVLRARHRLTYQPNDFTIVSVEQIAEQSQTAIAGFNLFLLVIGGISLLVGGIGIMNIMLVSVTQRTREIGLRKAVGARGRDIMVQFLIEALVLSLIGGAIGIGVGYLLSFAGTFVMQSVFLIPDGQAVVTLPSIVAATVVSGVVGITFGLFPAVRAARLEPIRALRFE
jgi:putative ABC transport system permease protein